VVGWAGTVRPGRGELPWALEADAVAVEADAVAVKNDAAGGEK
jgi:hypothetical protein